MANFGLGGGAAGGLSGFSGGGRSRADDEEFQRANENLARVMGRGTGRGMTNGAASTRGRAGTPTRVPAGAMGNTYSQQNPMGDNPVEIAGKMNRAAQAGDDDELIKIYNDSPMSSVTDATKITRDENGDMIFWAGGRQINKKGVSVDDFMNISGNPLTGQNVYQRSPGSPMEAGAGGGQGLAPAQSKSAVKSAEMVGGAKVDKWKDEIKAFQKKMEITKPEDQPELQARIDHAKGMLDRAVMDAGGNIYGAGMPATGGQRQPDPGADMQQLVNENLSDNEIKQMMWDRYGDDGVMRGVEAELQARRQEPSGFGQREFSPTGGEIRPEFDLEERYGSREKPKSSPYQAPGGMQPTGASKKYEGEQKIKAEKAAKKQAKMEVSAKLAKVSAKLSTPKTTLKGVTQGGEIDKGEVEYLQSLYESEDPSITMGDKKRAYSLLKKYWDSQR